jgi:4-hydroxyphenylpyruvate dioxygenase-like putative hemolysin
MHMPLSEIGDIPRLDHLAYRVLDRDKAFEFFKLLGYSLVTEFEIHLEDGSTAYSYAIKSPAGPEVFVSSGPPGSLIWKWVQEKGGLGAVHHVAYGVDDVASVMRDWTARGIEFQSSEPIRCPCPKPLVQVFTKPHPATGVIVELIERNGHPGFCLANVKKLMESGAKR